jgi:hypothetical protein
MRPGKQLMLPPIRTDAGAERRPPYRNNLFGNGLGGDEEKALQLARERMVAAILAPGGRADSNGLAPRAKLRENLVQFLRDARVGRKPIRHVIVAVSNALKVRALTCLVHEAHFKSLGQERNPLGYRYATRSMQHCKRPRLAAEFGRVLSPTGLENPFHRDP